VVGEVEMGNAEVEGGAADGPLGFMRRVAAEIVPEAERDCRKLQPAAAEAVIFHLVIAVFGRMPSHGVLSTLVWSMLTPGLARPQAARRRPGRLSPPGEETAEAAGFKLR